MPPKGLNAYRDNAVTTQTPGQIVVLLYEGAIKFLKQAIDAMEARRFTDKGILLNKAVAIISELNASLDLEKGGEIALNLRKLYVFMNQELVTANAKLEPGRIRNVVRLLETLHEGWKQIAA